jgi:histidinol-phosphate aminotransferase
MNYANQNIQNLKAYSPPLDGRSSFDGILLDFNERTIPISPKVEEAMVEYVKNKKIQVYPEYFDICKKIADYSKVKEEQVLITNGSDQGIELIFRTFTEKGDKVVIPAPSFAMFNQCASVIGNEIIAPTYTGVNLDFPTEEVVAAAAEDVSLVIICNPNNPTGTLASLEDIEKVLKAYLGKAIVMVDEAYFEFSQLSSTTLLSKYENLVITRTFSKAFGLAALRIGYVMANKAIIEEILKVRGPYDINVPAVVAASASLDNIEDTKNYIKEVLTVSKPYFENWLRENKIDFVPSAANFFLLKNCSSLLDKLVENKILARPRKGPGIDGSLRISIGTFEQTKKLTEILTKIL